jgi:hypothetical protein
MDNIFSNIFNFSPYVPLVAGGILGSYLGVRRVQHYHAPAVVAESNSEGTRHVVSGISNHLRSVGVIGYNSLYGMLVYPLLPPVLLPYVLRNDLRNVDKNSDKPTITAIVDPPHITVTAPSVTLVEDS